VDATLVYIQFMRAMRRAEGITGLREVPWCFSYL
jgi:hypothetical protein